MRERACDCLKLLSLDCRTGMLNRLLRILVLVLITIIQAQQSSAQTRFRLIETIAGNGLEKPFQEKGRATEIALTNPFGVQPESDGSLIIASYDQHVVYRLEPAFTRLERIAGTGERGFQKGSNLPSTSVPLNQPHEIQIDQAGNILIADTMNHRIGMITQGSRRWENIAGTGEPGFSGDGGPADKAQFNQAYSIAVDGNDLFLADLKSHRIRHIDLSTRIVQTICGTGEKRLPTDGGRAIDQPLAGPRSLAVDEDNLWIVLREGNSVWRYDRSDLRLYHVAGTGKKGFTGDGGDARQCTFAGPKGITVEPDVALYIADTENHAIRTIDLRSGTISTLVGANGKRGFNGDGDELAQRSLNRPHGVCLLPNGSLLIGDSENHRLRIVRR